MQTITKNPLSPKVQNQESFFVNGSNGGGVVTSAPIISKNELNIGDTVYLYSDKRPKKYVVIGFLEPLPFFDDFPFVILKSKNKTFQVRISDVKNNASPLSFNKSLKNRYASTEQCIEFGVSRLISRALSQNS